MTKLISIPPDNMNKKGGFWRISGMRITQNNGKQKNIKEWE